MKEKYVYIVYEEDKVVEVFAEEEHANNFVRTQKQIIDCEYEIEKVPICD